MRKLLLIITATSYCSFAGSLYGTANSPQINGSSYDVHKVFIEPNPGYQPTVTQASNNESTQQMIIRPAKHNENSPVINFKSDSWATDSRVERALKVAASEGKLGYVLDQAKKANVPASVAIVPIVESNYNKKAVSNKGAAGAWQLMPATAGGYGLNPVDRFNFASSTQIAIQILNDLHSEFGNWALAFAAYNCGDSCVRNALRKNPTANNIDELSLPAETKDYVHKIIELNQLIAGLDKATNKEY